MQELEINQRWVYEVKTLIKGKLKVEYSKINPIDAVEKLIEKNKLTARNDIIVKKLFKHDSIKDMLEFTRDSFLLHVTIKNYKEILKDVR